MIVDRFNISFLALVRIVFSVGSVYVRTQGTSKHALDLGINFWIIARPRPRNIQHPRLRAGQPRLEETHGLIGIVLVEVNMQPRLAVPSGHAFRVFRATEEHPVTTSGGEEFRLLRALDDGAFPSEEAIPLAEKAAATYPGFAPFQLVLGDLYRDQAEKDRATAQYRKGLEIVAEPDLESRLLCALAGMLPKGSQERIDLVKRAVALKGSLVAQATAVLIGL